MASQLPEFGEPRTVIGVDDGPLELTFDRIRRIEVDRDGNIFVLDRSSQNIRWFSGNGKHQGTIGRSGGGPGEFRRPWAIAIGSDRRLHVVDYGSGRLSVFRYSDGGYEYENSIRLPAAAHDICTIGTRRYILTPEDPNEVIKEIDSAGGVINSFGEPLQYHPDHARAFRDQLRARVNQGRLACDSAAAQVTHHSEATHEIRTFSPDGRLIWQILLEDIGEINYQLVRGMCCAGFADPSTGFTSFVEEITRSPSGTLLISVLEYPVGGEGRYHVLRELRASDGAELSRARAPGAVVSVTVGTVVSYVQRPVPLVFVQPAY